jgi:hypothetical protein
MAFGSAEHFDTGRSIAPKTIKTRRSQQWRKFREHAKRGDDAPGPALIPRETTNSRSARTFSNNPAENSVTARSPAKLPSAAPAWLRRAGIRTTETPSPHREVAELPDQTVSWPLPHGTVCVPLAASDSRLSTTATYTGSTLPLERYELSYGRNIVLCRA